MTEQQQLKSAINVIKRGSFGTGEFYEDDGEPRLYLMAYCGQPNLLLETFAAGYKVYGGLLYAACRVPPTFRGYSHDGHYPHWPEGFRETTGQCDILSRRTSLSFWTLKAELNQAG